MLGETAAQRPAQGHENHRDDHRRQHRVAAEQGEVESADHAEALEARHAMVNVIPEVADQKQGRGSGRREHEGPMGTDPAPTDGEITC